MDFAAIHPIVVHFSVALLVVGALFRVLAFVRRLAFLGPSAAVLLLLGTFAAAVSVQSGEAAHEPAERIPGANRVVHEHGEWGERVLYVFIGVSLLELGALGLGFLQAKRERLRGYLLAGSAGLGTLGQFAVYEAAGHGGQVVYEHGGGVGTRSGEPESVTRLLVAGLYHQARLDRESGRSADAARLIEEMSRRRPHDSAVALLAIDSLIRDQGDVDKALAALDALKLAPENTRERVRAGLLRHDALAQGGRLEEARSVLKDLRQDFPESRAVAERAEEFAKKQP